MIPCVFQSIEREEPIEVDPAPPHVGLENGHAPTTGEDMVTTVAVQVLSVLQTKLGDYNTTQV